MQITKRLFIYAGFFLFAFGCSQSEQAKFQGFIQKSKARGPAQLADAARPRCFIDRFQNSEIQKEVNQMESDYAGGKTGSYVVDAATTITDLPQASLDALSQTHYIDVTSYKGWIEANASQKECKSLPCIINSHYANPSNEGLLHYWYFLKTGYAMSAIDAYPWVVPRSATDPSLVQSLVTVSGVAHENYLFDKLEWKAWWLQGNLLPKSMLHMPSIYTVHRVPHGYIPPDWKTSGVCAWAYGSAFSGIVLLGDRCLTLSERAPFDTENYYFYQATTHEMGHRLSSWNFANPAKGSARLSWDETPEFLALSQWAREELTDGSGNVRFAWVHGNGPSVGFVSDYAKSSPAEDFAESVGTYRMRPDWQKKSAPRKYDYFKEKVFAGKGYIQDDLRSTYAQEIGSRLMNTVSDWAASCLVNSPTLPALTDAEQRWYDQINLKTTLPLDLAVQNCIKAQYVVEVQRIQDDLRYEEPEGCKTLDVASDEIEMRARVTALPALIQYFKTDRRVTDLLSGVQAYRAAVMQEFDGRTLYLSCYSTDDPKVCYDQRLASESERISQKYRSLLTAGTQELIEVEKNRFLSINQFSEMTAQVGAFYRSLFSQSDSDLSESVKSAWGKCSILIPTTDATAVVTEPYSAGSYFVSPNILNCLNQNGTKAIDQEISDVASAQNIDHFSTDAKVWISNEILIPLLRLKYDALVQTASLQESDRLNQMKQSVEDQTYAYLTSNLSWQKSAMYSYDECKVATIPQISSRMNASSIRFVATPPMVASWVDDVCARIQKFVSTSPSDSDPVSMALDLAPVWSGFSDLMVAAARTRYDQCNKGIYFSRALKKACLVDKPVIDDRSGALKTAWEWTRDEAIRGWIVSSSVRTYLSDKNVQKIQVLEMAKQRANNQRQILVDAIYADFFKN